MSLGDLSPQVLRAALAGVITGEELDDSAIVDRFAAVVWNALTEPGDGIAGALVATLGAADALLVVVGEDALPAGAVAAGVAPEDYAKALARWRPRRQRAAIDASLAVARRSGVRLLFPADAGWPRQLDDLGVHAPLALWVRGEVDALSRLQPSVALVGARAATGYGEHVAMELAAELAGGGIPIVSGAAYGIDGMAHRAALAAGGLTVALLAGGVERPYPSGHAELIERIGRQGAAVSEVPCGSTPTKWRFLQRNRLIAALSDATVVVEAGWRSGSLNTAGHAAALARPLGAVPGPVTSPASAGCHRLLREFDARCITSADDVRELLGVDAPGRQANIDLAPSAQPRTDDRTRVHDALSIRVLRDADEIARRSGMSRADVESHLGLLRLEGEVEGNEQGWRRVARAPAR